MAKFRQRLFEIIGPSKKGDKLSVAYDIFICTLASLCSVAVVLELIHISDAWNKALLIFEYVAVGIFIVEYVIKLTLADLFYPECKNKLEAFKKYVTSFDAFIDLLSILSVLINQIPKEVSVLKFLKLIKLVRLAKLGDYTKFEKLQKSTERFQKRLHEIIEKDAEKDVLSRIYDIAITLLVILSCSILILETFPLTEGWHKTISIFEIVLACIFAVEYVARVYVAPQNYPDIPADEARMKYIFSFMSFVDLLSIVPVFVVGLPNTAGVFKILKLCKIVRLVKVSRYINGFALFGKAIKEKTKQIIFSVVALMLLIVICSVLMYSFEHEAQPEIFTNGFSGIVYGFTSITSFGETELAPITTAGKVLSTVMLLLGGCIFGIPVAIIGDAFGKMISHQANDEEEEEQDTVFDLMEKYKELSDEDKATFREFAENKLHEQEHCADEAEEVKADEAAKA